MGATIAVSEDLAKELKILKLEEGRKSMEELLREIVSEYKKRRYLSASEKFRKRMEAKGLRPRDIE